MNDSPLHRRRTQALSLLIAAMLFGYGHAGMISTEQIISPLQLEQNKQTIVNALTREDVKQALTAHGVDPLQAQQRVDQLTHQEIHTLATKFDELPAASGVGLILFAAGPIVLMLELMGYTDLTTTF